MKYIRSTLVNIFNGNEMLLGMKKRGLGVGKWNGFGGKLTVNETLKQCAVREVEEECGITVSETDLTKIGILMFEFIGENLFLEVNVFKTSIFKGAPIESEEMTPKWFSKENVPLQSMWADDKLWYPLMFQNKLFFGLFKFEGHDNMVYDDLKVVSSLEDMQKHRKSTCKEYSLDI